MEEKYLIINAGSSSLKFSLNSMPSGKEKVKGIVERIGENESTYTLKFDGKKVENGKVINNHTEAVQVVLDELLKNNFINSLSEISAVGHRVLHGGEFYSESVIVDDDVLKNINSLIKLGPLHIPGEVACILIMMKCLPLVPQVAVFDTAFHQTMPKENYLYAVPYSWYAENGVRKYGFHGTSHKYITEVMQKKLNREDVNLIVCHIGSGASIACIKNGKCYDTTMGLTPLDGIMMGTRSGSIDSSIIEYISKEKNLDIEKINTILNKESGLKGIAGKNDFRDIETMVSNGDEQAILAVDMLKNSIVKYIAQYYFELEGNVDAIVFTAGMGENAAIMRKCVVDAISKPMGIKLNEDMNDNIAKFRQYQSGEISTDDSKIKVLVIPTNEEYMILKDTYELTKEKDKVKIKSVDE